MGTVGIKRAEVSEDMYSGDHLKSLISKRLCPLTGLCELRSRIRYACWSAQCSMLQGVMGSQGACRLSLIRGNI